MIKHNVYAMTCLAATLVMAACESDHQLANSYELACLASGGNYHNSACYCADEETPCEPGILCLDNKCALDKSHATMCAASGGTPDEDRCICGGIRCNAGILCNTVTKQCANQTECTGEEISCFNSYIHTCNQGTWKEGEHCEFGCHSDGQTCNTSCSENAKHCENGILKTCLSGHWTNEQPCTYQGEEVSCKTDAACGECKDNATRACAGGIAEKCQNGAWQNGFEECPNSVSCTEEGRCGECQNGTIKA